MKTEFSILISACIGITLLSGCGKKEETSTQPLPAAESLGKTAGEAVKSFVSNASVEAQKAVETVKTTAQQVATEATTQAKTAADSVSSEFNKLYEQAKAFVTEKKYKESLSVIQQISNLKITPEQQKLVDDLKVQVQKLLGEEATKGAASAIEGALGGKK